MKVEKGKKQMINWISVKESLPTKVGRYLTAHSTCFHNLPYSYEILNFSFNLNALDEYHFPKKHYKNKKGFYYYDSELGYVERPNIEFWAIINTPNETEKEETE